MAGALAMSQSEAVREAALGFAFSPNSAVSSAALVAVSQQKRGGVMSSKVVDRLVRMRPRFSETRRTDIDTVPPSSERDDHVTATQSAHSSHRPISPNFDWLLN